MTSASVKTLFKGIQISAAHIVWKEILTSCCFFSLHWEEEDVIFFFFVLVQKPLTLEQAEVLKSVKGHWMHAELSALHTVIHWNDQTSNQMYLLWSFNVIREILACDRIWWLCICK